MVANFLGYRTTAQLWNIDDPALAVRLDALIGGTPAYRRELVDDDAPADLAEDPLIRDRDLYAAVLAAIALGRTTRGAIADHVGRPAADLAHVLEILEGDGWPCREEDALWSRRPRYRLVDLFMAFERAIGLPEWTALKRSNTA